MRRKTADQAETNAVAYTDEEVTKLLERIVKLEDEVKRLKVRVASMDQPQLRAFSEVGRQS